MRTVLTLTNTNSTTSVAREDDDDDVYIRRVRRPSRSQTRVTYSPRETRTRVSQTFITEAPRPQHVIEDRPRAQYLSGPPQHVGARIYQSERISREFAPPPAPVPPPPPLVRVPPPITPPPPPVVRAPPPVNKAPQGEIVKEKETIVEKEIEKKIEKSPPQPVETRLEIVSVEHSNPRRSHSSINRKHSRHGSRTSESTRGDRHEREGIIVERERETRSRRYLIEPGRKSVPDYDTYRYIEAPPAKKEVRYIEDNPRRSTGMFRERERERERVVVDNGGRRRRDYSR